MTENMFYSISKTYVYHIWYICLWAFWYLYIINMTSFAPKTEIAQCILSNKCHMYLLYAHL